VSFKNTVIIMTSNAPKDALKEIFRPEFLNRLDEILEFEPLSEAQIAQIVKLQIADFARRLAEQRISLQVDDAALALLAKEGYDPAYGARPVKRAIQRRLENPIARKIIEGFFAPGDSVRVTAREGSLSYGKA
jgi:ATP-dependent Clp protease ATP-binding subunit ClpB